MSKQAYTEDSILSLDWKEHIRLRPGMYIGKIGNGSSPDDGVYVLLKEVLDNCIDEYVMGHGKTIEVSIKNNRVSVQDFGRGIPLGKFIKEALCTNKSREHKNHNYHQNPKPASSPHKSLKVFVQLLFPQNFYRDFITNT